MVSPLNTNGQDAATSNAGWGPRAAVSGEAITYTSRGLFGEPTGGDAENQFLSSRGSEGWSTQSITPLHDPFATEVEPPYEGDAFTPELTAGIANTNSPLVEGAAGGKKGGEYGLYVADLGGGSYRYVAPVEGGEGFAFGVSSDLTRVMLEKTMWVNGSIVPVMVTNEGEQVDGAVGAETPTGNFFRQKDSSQAVSSDGSRVYFTSPSNEEEPAAAQLYLRMNVGQPQSPITSTEASGTGTLTLGSDVVSALVSAAGVVGGELQKGSTSYMVLPTAGRFAVGEHVAGPGIAPGTTVTAVSITPVSHVLSTVLTLSAPTTETVESTVIFSEGPEPFVVGQEISGDGIPQGTTVTAVAKGSLTLSNAAASSGAGVALNAGGRCTVAGDACTVNVSVSQRLRANPAGIKPVRYWGASADGSKVFFTSKAELTENAYTGPAGNAPNLYEYELASEPGQPGRLTDLTVDESGDGAGVLGVVQISEEGAYVYFVAEGAMAAGATAGQRNLYVSHDGGTPRFIATLAAGDISDWENGELTRADEAGPEVNTAVVNPSGSRLAFMSDASLTGYDNQQAAQGDCNGEGGSCSEVFVYDAESQALACASCNPTGARPVGPSSVGRPTKSVGLYRPRNLLEDGVLFFESSDALVPSASDTHNNVYEYENGRAYAISDVTGAYESFFLDASASGNDVFFATADQLLERQDTGNNLVVFDARVNGGFPAPASAEACTSAEVCLPAQTSQPEQLRATGTATFSGPGNLTPPPAKVSVVLKKTPAQIRAAKFAKALKGCRRDRSKRKRVLCERAVRKRYGPVKAKKASSEKRVDSASGAGGERGAGR
jgi:hypothetical protein